MSAIYKFGFGLVATSAADAKSKSASNLDEKHHPIPQSQQAFSALSKPNQLGNTSPLKNRKITKVVVSHGKQDEVDAKILKLKEIKALIVKCISNGEKLPFGLFSDLDIDDLELLEDWLGNGPLKTEVAIKKGTVIYQKLRKNKLCISFKEYYLKDFHESKYYILGNTSKSELIAILKKANPNATDVLLEKIVNSDDSCDVLYKQHIELLNRLQEIKLKKLEKLTKKIQKKKCSLLVSDSMKKEGEAYKSFNEWAIKSLRYGIPNWLQAFKYTMLHPEDTYSTQLITEEDIKDILNVRNHAHLTQVIKNKLIEIFPKYGASVIKGFIMFLDKSTVSQASTAFLEYCLANKAITPDPSYCNYHTCYINHALQMAWEMSLFKEFAAIYKASLGIIDQSGHREKFESLQSSMTKMAVKPSQVVVKSTRVQARSSKVFARVIKVRLRQDYLSMKFPEGAVKSTQVLAKSKAHILLKVNF